jgi:Tfp pilus assembly protein PilF
MKKRVAQVLVVLLLACATLAAEGAKEQHLKPLRRRRRQNHKAAGIAQSKQGDLDAAIVSFRRAVVINPADSSGYNNLGVALMRHGIEMENVALLRQAEESFRASMDILPSPATKDNLDMVDQYLKDRGAKASSASSSTAAAAEVGADGSTMAASSADTRKSEQALLRQRIASACNERQVRIKVRASDHKAGSLSAKKLAKAEHLLGLCGVVVLERLFTPDFTTELREAQTSVVDRFLGGIQENPSLTNSTWSEQRSPGRYELLSPMEPPFTNEELLKNPLLHPLMVRTLKTHRIEVDTHSSVTSLAETPAQHWHRDAGFILESTKTQLPPHGLVVFIPLKDVSNAMGPTQFLTGSHIKCERNEQKEIRLGNWILEECPFVGPTIRTPAPLGSAIIFDLRILHRGLANTMKVRRPQLYVTFFQEWYVDHVNFNAKQSTEFDMLPPSLRKMLSRVDTKSYVLTLEEKLKEFGVDPMSLQSSYNYKKNSFDTKS